MFTIINWWHKFQSNIYRNTSWIPNIKHELILFECVFIIFVSFSLFIVNKLNEITQFWFSWHFVSIQLTAITWNYLKSVFFVVSVYHINVYLEIGFFTAIWMPLHLSDLIDDEICMNKRLCHSKCIHSNHSNCYEIVFFILPLNMWSNFVKFIH